MTISKRRKPPFHPGRKKLTEIRNQSVYGMNISENSGPKLWSLWSFVVISAALTLLTFGLAMLMPDSLSVKSLLTLARRKERENKEP